MKFLGKRILIQPTPATGMTTGGIIIPDRGRVEDQEGIVIAIGSGVTEATEYKKGSRVYLEMYKAAHVEIEGNDYIVADQQSVIGIDVDGRFHPIGDRIMLKPTMAVLGAGVIHRPSAYDHDADLPILCSIHALGSGIKLKSGERIPFDVKIGDMVYILPFSGRDVDTMDQQYKLVRQKDLICQIENL